MVVPTAVVMLTVFFSGHQSDYTFASSEDGLTVTVTDRSTGDFDTVTNVETLSFDDGDIAVSHDGTGLVLTGQSADNIEVVGSVGQVTRFLVRRVMTT